uniref:Uncharacterized protein n=1 Tax=Canis lupus dingo TaxID=286419 RepID=A0A8C0KK65_CANLU
MGQEPNDDAGGDVVALVSVLLHGPEGQHGRAQEQRAPPDHQAVELGPAHPAHPAHGHGFHQGQVAVDAHQHQEADAAVEVHVEHGVHHAAQHLPEEPVEVVGDGDGPEGQPGGQDQVCQGQVAQVDLSHRPPGQPPWSSLWLHFCSYRKATSSVPWAWRFVSLRVWLSPD